MRLFTHLNTHAYSTALLAALGIALTASAPIYAGKPTTKKNSQEASISTTLALESENYNFRNLSGDNSCLGEDDHLIWEAVGSLQPGESFTFTPQYPACAYHSAAITAQLSWEGSELELSSSVPYRDFASSDIEQTGRAIVAPNVGNTAQLCMFPKYQEEGINYSITVTNVGTGSANSIVFEGKSQNGWVRYYYNRCVNADADNDGWNDAMEQTMASLTRYIGSINGEFQMNKLWGPNYLRDQASTMSVDDEVDSYPADFNDDGAVDQLDLDKLLLHMGEGNGLALELISPNPSDAEYFYNQVHVWRRYDLNLDGFVTQTDADIVASLFGYSLPLAEDIIAPTASITFPENGATIAKNNYLQIKGHVWDNASITQVDYIVDGRTECSATRPAANTYGLSPFYYCGWSVPKRSGTHELEIQVHDGAGNVSSSGVLQVTAQ
jgi:hypothetical protein